MIKVAYIMSRFPKLTETFVLNEIVAMKAKAVHVEIFPLLRGPSRVVHEEVARLSGSTHYEPFISWPVLNSNLRVFFRSPRKYFRLLWDVLRSTAGSANFFIGALGIFPKSVRFAEHMRRLGITHVHAHFANHPAVAAFIVSRLTGIPFSFTAHGSDLHVERRMLPEKVAAAKFVVTVSDYNKELIVSECGETARQKVAVIHCGVDCGIFAPGLSKPYSPLQILCVASFEEVKGHRHLVSACRLLHDRGIDYQCHLVGNGPLRRDIERQINDAGLTLNFKIHGGLPRTDILQLMSQAHIFVLASVPTAAGKREGIPVALMEAMAAEVPVVSSRLSGIPELVEHEKSGILVQPGDSAALADAIERLARTPDLRARLGETGRKRVQHEFDLHMNAGRLLEWIRTGSGAARASSVSSAEMQPVIKR